jgi:anti-sigma regulatory factor (Ser/Thr protein kinase)
MGQYYFVISSNIIEADLLKEKIRNILLGYFKEDKIDSLLFCFHELLNNAIEHGNKMDSAKKVYINLTMHENSVIFSIEDQGIGFDWQTRVGQELDVNSFSERGRGIIMTKLMCDEIKYNNIGNKVTCLKTFT